MKLIPLLALLLLASQPATMLITIDSNGVVEAHLSLKTIEGLNEVRLPVEPIPETIEVRVGSKYVAAIYENGILYFFSPMPGDAEITYMVNISARNNILSFDIGGENLTRLRIPPQVILLTVPRNITGMEYVEGDLVIEFYGPERIEYAVRAGATTQPTITTTRAETMTPTMKTATSTVETIKMVITITQTGTTSTHAAESTGKLGISLTDPAIIVGLIVIVIIMVVAILAYSKSRGRGMPGEDHTLTKLDRMILESIENAGGSILQGELQAALGLPKTTLWRHVKKLGKLGYIQIVKEGTLNRLILLKKPSRGFSPSS